MRKWRWQIAIATAAITTMMIPGNKILAEEAMTGAEEQSEYNMRFADDGTESGVTIYYGSLYRTICANGKNILVTRTTVDGTEGNYLYLDQEPYGTFGEEDRRLEYIDTYAYMIDGLIQEAVLSDNVDYATVSPESTEQTELASRITLDGVKAHRLWIQNSGSAEVNLNQVELSGGGYITSCAGDVTLNLKNSLINAGIGVTTQGTINGDYTVNMDGTTLTTGSLSDGTVLGNTTVNLKNSMIRGELQPVHNAGTAEAPANVQITIDSSTVESISGVNWNYNGDTGHLYGNLTIDLVNGANSNGLVSFTGATSKAAIHGNAVMNLNNGSVGSVATCIYDPFGEEDSYQFVNIDGNATINLNGATIEESMQTCVTSPTGTVYDGITGTNLVNVNADTIVPYFEIKDLNLNQAKWITNKNGYFYGKLSGKGTLGLDVTTSAYMGFQKDYSIDSKSSLTLSPMKKTGTNLTYQEIAKTNADCGNVALLFDDKQEAKWMPYFHNNNFEVYIPETEKGRISLKVKPVLSEISSLSFTGVDKKAYTGKEIKPDVVIKKGSTKLKKGTDYTLTYKNNVNTGRATIIVKGKGNYTGTKTMYFNIVPKKVSLTSIKSTKSKQMTVKWKKATGASGYIIQYSTSKKFTGAKKIYVKKGTTLTKTVKKLKSKKTYYVRVCAYKLIKGSYQTGSYSAARTVKVK